jgi:fructoselysine and glucoselysine-specific PTS system IIA component
MAEEGYKRKFLIATHGALAGGIRSALEMITGPAENVFFIEAYLDGNPSIEGSLRDVVDQVKATEELVIFSDLLGGSVNNQVLRFALRDRVHVVSGFNLPLVIDVMLSDPDISTPEAIRSALERAKEQMVYVNDRIANPQMKQEDD